MGRQRCPTTARTGHPSIGQGTHPRPETTTVWSKRAGGVLDSRDSAVDAARAAAATEHRFKCPDGSHGRAREAVGGRVRSGPLPVGTPNAFLASLTGGDEDAPVRGLGPVRGRRVRLVCLDCGRPRTGAALRRSCHPTHRIRSARSHTRDRCPSPGSRSRCSWLSTLPRRSPGTR